eukprot:149199-Pelagomonas_calceolata.AAC.2
MSAYEDNPAALVLLILNKAVSGTVPQYCSATRERGLQQSTVAANRMSRIACHAVRANPRLQTARFGAGGRAASSMQIL